VTRRGAHPPLSTRALSWRRQPGCTGVISAALFTVVAVAQLGCRMRPGAQSNPSQSQRTGKLKAMDESRDLRLSVTLTRSDTGTQGSWAVQVELENTSETPVVLHEPVLAPRVASRIGRRSGSEITWLFAYDTGLRHQSGNGGILDLAGERLDGEIVLDILELAKNSWRHTIKEDLLFLSPRSPITTHSKLDVHAGDVGVDVAVICDPRWWSGRAAQKWSDQEGTEYSLPATRTGGAPEWIARDGIRHRLWTGSLYVKLELPIAGGVPAEQAVQEGK